MGVWFCNHPPVLVDDEGRVLLPIRPDPRLFDAAAKVGAISDFVVVPSNGAHFFAQEIERSAGKPLLNMVHLALDAVQERGWKRVGVMGLGEPVVYTVPLKERSVDCVTLEADLRNRVDRSIFAMMAGRANDERRAAVREAVEWFTRAGVDGIILGCTELPLLLEGSPVPANAMDPLDFLVKAAVERALEM
jgi:aspartate racemase